MPKTARNAEYTKEYNRKTVLKLLRIAPMSRSAIAREMGLTRATLSLIAEKLITDGIIREDSAGEAHQGRTPVPLYLCPDAYYTIGVYLNRKSCRVALVNINEDILLKKSVNIDEHNESLKITLLADCIRSIISESEVPREKIIGIGVSCPGPIDSKNGRILNPPYFDIWHHTDICSLLNRMLDLPVRRAAAEQIEQAKAKVAVDGEKAWNARLLLRYEEVQTEVTHPTPVQVFGIGNAAIAALPGEPYHRFAVKIREGCPKVNFLFSALSNGMHGYIPVPELMETDIYEAKLCEGSFLDPSAGDAIAETVVRMLDGRRLS